MKVWNNKLFLLTLAMVLCLGMSMAMIACDDDDDDDDDTTGDDDTFGGDDDDATDDDATDDDVTDDDDDDDADDDDVDDDDVDDDDDDATDDDTGGAATCDDIADGMLNTCSLTLLDMGGVQQDEGGLVEWCELSEAMYAKSASAFWNCMGDCVFFEFCDEACFDDCLAPADPGSGCGHTVHGIYNCEVTFVFSATDYWIPEMDMHEVCDMFDDDWACYQVCVDSECDGGGSQGQDLIDCMNANCV